MRGIYTPLIGRFGNKMFQWAYAKALADSLSAELVTPRWEGEFLFGLPETREKRDDDTEIGEYRQQQKDLTYTRQQVREWFKIKPEILDTLRPRYSRQNPVVGHRRGGDYIGYGYPVVSIDSYLPAAQQFGYDSIEIISDDTPRSHHGYRGELSFIPDFVALTQAKVLFRGNSTFSWWAATLSNAEIYSPVIDDLEGGKEHFVTFVAGNHPKFCNLPCVTDLYLQE
jgi:hypothetical protein